MLTALFVVSLVFVVFDAFVESVVFVASLLCFVYFSIFRFVFVIILIFIFVFILIFIFLVIFLLIILFSFITVKTLISFLELSTKENIPNAKPINKSNTMMVLIIFAKPLIPYLPLSIIRNSYIIKFKFVFMLILRYLLFNNSF